MIGTIIGIIGIVLAVIFYFKSKPVSRINYQTSNLKIIGNISLKLPTDFEVTLSGEKIESLYKSQVIIWNGGTTTLYGKDIVEEEPLRVVFDKDTIIFNVAVVGESRKANKFNATVDDANKDVVKLSLDYLNRNDGVLLEILHTESTVDPKVIGELKGLSNGIKGKGKVDYVGAPPRKLWLRFLIIRVAIPLVFSLAVSAVLLFLFKIISESAVKQSNFSVFLSVAMGLFFGTSGVTELNHMFKKRYPRSIRFKK